MAATDDNNVKGLGESHRFPVHQGDNAAGKNHAFCPRTSPMSAKSAARRLLAK
jgi:hypothetical protein